MSVFIKKANKWQMCENVKEDGSIREYLEELGYDHNQFYSYTDYHKTYDDETRNDKIFAVCLKAMSEEIICVIASKGMTSLTDEDVREYMKNFDFKSQYSLYTLESDLDAAINERNYSIKFVAEALGLPYSPNDKMLHSEKFKYNFFFEGGILISYETSDGYGKEAHELKESSPSFYELIENHARSYHGTNEDEIVRETNIQARAYMNIPGGVRNDYFYSFQNADSSFNMAMLLVTKYQGTQYALLLNYDDCKCVCHNELKFDGEITEGLDKILKYRYRDYLISFDDKGRFLSCKEEPKDYSSLESGCSSHQIMEKKVLGLDFKLSSLSSDRLQILKNYLTDLSHGKTASCYIYSTGGSIGCYDEDNNLFYTLDDSELKAWVEEEGLLIGVFGVDEIEKPEAEGVITLPLSVFFHAKECDDNFENAIYHIRALHMELLRIHGIMFK